MGLPCFPQGHVVGLACPVKQVLIINPLPCLGRWAVLLSHCSWAEVTFVSRSSFPTRGHRALSVLGRPVCPWW